MYDLRRMEGKVLKKRILAILLCSALLLGVSGCGGPAPGSNSTTEEKSSSGAESSSVSGAETSAGTCESTGCVWDAYTPYEETVVFSKGVGNDYSWANFKEGDDITHNGYVRYVKEQLNVEPVIKWEVAPNDEKQKISLAIASGDIPDVMSVDRTIFKQLVDNDLVEDMTDAYEKCISPFLREQYDQYGETLFKHVTVNGRMMGIPGTRITDLHSILWVRQDWLDKLGLEYPKTVDEIEAVAKAFIEQDPGGNGEGKTIGLTCVDTLYAGYGSQYSFDTLFSAMHAYPGNWMEKDGSAVYGSIQPEMKPALERLSKLYADGILDKEFAIRKTEDYKSLLSSGKLGIVIGGMWGPDGVLDCVVNNPEADWTVAAAPVDENGKHNIAANDPLQKILVVRKGYEHPEAIVKTLNVQYDIIRGNGEAGKAAYEKLAIEEPGLHYGVSPLDLDVSPNFYAKEIHDDIAQAMEKGDREAMKLQAFKQVYDQIQKDIANPKADKTAYQEHMQRTVGTEATTAENVVDVPVAFYGTTESMGTKWAALKKLETETFLKIVMGEKPIDEFDNFVNTWLSMGGQQITDEVNAAIKQ